MAVTTFANINAFEVPYEDGPMAATAVLYRNAIVLRNSSGDLINGATVAGAIGVGVAEVNTMVGTNTNTWDNSAGLAGAITARYRSGRFGYFANSGASITAGMEGKVCYCLDNVTVHATSNSGARSPAGIVYRVSSSGVIVEFDEMKVRALLAASNPSGISFTQTYSTANATVAAPTGVAIGASLTDNTGYSGTHDDTLAATTLPAVLVDNSGGVSGGNTIAVITQVANAGSADIAPTAAAIATLAAKLAEYRTMLDVVLQNQSDIAQKVIENVTLGNALVADDLDNRQSINSLIDAAQAAGIAG